MMDFVSSVRKGYSRWDHNADVPGSSKSTRLLKQAGCIAVFVAIFSVIVLPLLVGSKAWRTNPDPCKVWEEVRGLLSEHDNVSVIVGNGGGDRLIFSRGKASPPPSAILPVASASKWITATIVLKLVDRGDLSLDDKPSRYLDFWKPAPNDKRSGVELRHLLSFTSGLVEGGSLRCSAGSDDLPACARQIYEANSNMSNAPGDGIYYSGNHLVVAVAMAETKTGRSLNQLLQTLVIQQLGLHEQVHFSSKPFGLNPSGSLMISAIDYGVFLRTLLSKKDGFLSPRAYGQMLTPWTKNASKMSTLAPYIEGRAWEYGLGHWIECFDELSSDNRSIACPNASIQSSIGAFGFYPVLEAVVQGSDPHDHYLIISPQVPTSDFSKNYMLPSVLLHEQVRSQVRQVVSTLDLRGKTSAVCEERLD